MRAGAVLALGLLAACQAQPSVQQSAAAACVTYTETLRSLTLRKRAGTLDANAIERIDELNRMATPVCTADDPPAGAVQMIDGVLFELERILVEAEAE